MVLVLLAPFPAERLEQGTGPWNLEVQIVGPKGSEIIQIPGIETERKTLQIPIPKQVDQEGGTFEIDLGEHRYMTSQIIWLKLTFRNSQCRGQLQMQTIPLSSRRLS